MAAKRLRDVGIRFRQFDEKIEKLRQRRPLPAFCNGKPQGSEAGLLQPANLLMRQAALEFALHRTFSDAGKERPETCGECFIARAWPGAPYQIDLAH